MSNFTYLAEDRLRTTLKIGHTHKGYLRRHVLDSRLRLLGGPNGNHFRFIGFSTENCEEDLLRVARTIVEPFSGREWFRWSRKLRALILGQMPLRPGAPFCTHGWIRGYCVKCDFSRRSEIGKLAVAGRPRKADPAK